MFEIVLSTQTALVLKKKDLTVNLVSHESTTWTTTLHICQTIVLGMNLTKL